MSEDMIRSIWPEWETVGCLETDVFGKLHLAKSEGAVYAAVRE